MWLRSPQSSRFWRSLLVRASSSKLPTNRVVGIGRQFQIYVRFPPIADSRGSRHRYRMRQPHYLRRLVLHGLGWAVLAVAAVLVTHPSRVKLLLSGSIEWWRLAPFAAVTL